MNISLFEYEKKTYKSLGISPNDKLFKAIDMLNTSSGVEYLKLRRNHLEATNYVGIFMFKDWRIQVLPKIDFMGDANTDTGSEPQEKAARSAAENLIYMLSYINRLQISSSGMTSLSYEKDNWFEMLMFIFSVGLRDLVKTSIHKEYTTVDDELPFIKGKWLLGQQLIERPHLKHKFMVAFDEYSEDNILNRILKFCAHQMMLFTQNSETRNVLSDILDWFSSTELIQDASRLNIDKVVFTRINQHYKPLYNLAVMFINNRIFTMQSGEIDAFAIMFDMNRLFEEFVYSFIEKYKKEIFTESWNKFSVRYQAQGKKLYLAVLDGNNIFRLKPDILFVSRSGETIFVVDTKYKTLSPSLDNYGLSREDAFQMLAYATRFKSKNNILIYPQDARTSPVNQSIQFEENNVLLKIGTINLNQEIRNPAHLIAEFSRLFGKMNLQQGDLNG